MALKELDKLNENKEFISNVLEFLDYTNSFGCYLVEDGYHPHKTNKQWVYDMLELDEKTIESERQELIKGMHNE